MQITKLSIVIFSAVFLTISNLMEVRGQKSNLMIEPYVFENSKKEKVDAEFGRLNVPENRTKNSGKMIQIAFVRFKSTSKNPGSPIVYLAGGPGGSGIWSAKSTRFKLFMAMREFGDVIALDQRGTWKSKPYLRCAGRLDLALDRPMTPASVLKAESKGIKKCAEKWKSEGVDVSAYNTEESASDLNDLRLALGEDKISLWGISYGTHLALATIRRYGKHVDRAILAGVEGVDDTIKLPSYTQNVFEDLDRRVKLDAELSKSIPSFLGLVERVHSRLARRPVTVELTNSKSKTKTKVTIGKFDLQFLVSAFSGDNKSQSMMPGQYYAMANGDFSMLARNIARYRKGGVSSLMSVAMDCASGISKSRRALIAREKAVTLFSNAINEPFPGICSSIDHANLGKRFRKRVKSSVPTLFISGTLDGRTPVSNAKSAQMGFKNSTHLIIDGAGHSDPLFLSSPKIAETMYSFMRRNKLPRTISIEMAKPFKFLPIRDDK